MSLRKKLFLLLDIVGIIVLVLADQFTKPGGGPSER